MQGNTISPVRVAMTPQLSTPIRTLQETTPSQERMGKFLALLKRPTVDLEQLRCVCLVIVAGLAGHLLLNGYFGFLHFWMGTFVVLLLVCWFGV